MSLMFFFKPTASTDIYTLSLHDALPISVGVFESRSSKSGKLRVSLAQLPDSPARLNVGSYTVNLDVLVEYVEDRKSTRLNSSHLGISYAVFCLKKKKTQKLLH